MSVPESTVERNKRVVVDYYETAFAGEPEKAVAEHFGDLVVTHSHLILRPGEPGRALADFFRLADGKVVEHWDVVQDVPTTSANSNGMF